MAARTGGPGQQGGPAQRAGRRLHGDGYASPGLGPPAARLGTEPGFRLLRYGKSSQAPEKREMGRLRILESCLKD